MDKPAVLGTAIAKIFLALQALPKESIFVRATTNLFPTSSISRRPQILSTHTRVGERLQNILRRYTGIGLQIEELQALFFFRWL